MAAGVLARQGPVRDTVVQAQVGPAVPLMYRPSSMPEAESAQTSISMDPPRGLFPEQLELAIWANHVPNLSWTIRAQAQTNQRMDSPDHSARGRECTRRVDLGKHKPKLHQPEPLVSYLLPMPSCNQTNLSQMHPRINRATAHRTREDQTPTQKCTETLSPHIHVHNISAQQDALQVWLSMKPSVPFLALLHVLLVRLAKSGPIYSRLTRIFRHQRLLVEPSSMDHLVV